MSKPYSQHKDIPFTDKESASEARKSIFGWARHKGGAIEVKLKKVA